VSLIKVSGGIRPEHFRISAALQDALYVYATGPSGEVGSFTSDGWQGPELPNPPYHDLQLVTFSGAEISHLSLSDFFDRRADIIIDDLSFTRDTTSVPEPSALSLLAAGFGMMLLRRKLFKNKRLILRKCNPNIPSVYKNVNLSAFLPYLFPRHPNMLTAFIRQ